MSSKRDKPALFELVNRGPLKPDSQGALKTPGWFYRGKSGIHEPDGPKKETQVCIEKEVNVKKAPSGWLRHFVDRKPDGSTKPTDREPFAKTENAIVDKPVLKTKKLPFWLIPLAFLAVVLIVLVIFRIGQYSGFEAAKDKVEGPPDRTLETVRQGPVKQGLIPPSAPAVTPAAVKALPPARPELTAALPPTADVPVAKSKDGNVLVFCGNNSQQELTDVRDFFVANGIECKIGRMNGRFVLYSTQPFVNTRDTEAAALFSRVIEIGKRYNSEKPKGAARFNAETFESSFWVKTGIIE